MFGSFAVFAAGLPLAGCGGGSGDGAAPAPTPPAPPAPPPISAVGTFAYVANTGSADVSIFQCQTGGALELVATLPSVGGAFSVVVHPSGRLAYAVGNQDIVAYEIDPVTRKLGFKAIAASVNVPLAMRIHPSGKFAYVIEDGTRSVLSFSIESSGALSTSTPPLTFGGNPNDLAIDSAGNFVRVARADGFVSSHAVNPVTGALGAASVTPTGGSANSIVVLPSGRALYAKTNDGIAIHGINGAGDVGAATFMDIPGLELIRIDPLGRFAYCIAEVGEGVEFSAFTINPGTGGLNLEETMLIPEARPADMAISPLGQFIYTADPINHRVQAFAIHQETGALTQLDRSFEAGSEPAGIALVEFVD